MALTESEKTELKNDILNAIKAESQSVDELVEVSSLDNIKSLYYLAHIQIIYRRSPGANNSENEIYILFHQD